MESKYRLQARRRYRSQSRQENYLFASLQELQDGLIITRHVFYEVIRLILQKVIDVNRGYKTSEVKNSHT